MNRKICWFFSILLIIGMLCNVCIPLSGEAGCVAILYENFPSKSSHADPLELRNYLVAHHFDVQLISADDLADPTIMSSEKINVIILPYGSYFPLDARDTFINYLKKGGAFVSLGGYAFDDLMKKKNGVWKKETSVKYNDFLSGRRGQQGDWIKFQSDQIVIFDSTYTFKRVAILEPNPTYFTKFDAINEKISIAGFPATAMTGNNTAVFAKPNARWISLVQAYDKYHQLRGSVFSLMYQYDGFYEGAAWAFSGVTNINLFSRAYPGMLDMLKQAIRAIQERVCLVDVVIETHIADSPEIALVVRVANLSDQTKKVNLALYGVGQPDWKLLTLTKRSIVRQEYALQVKKLPLDYTPIQAVIRIPLSEASGFSEINDALTTAYIKPGTFRSLGPKIAFHDNYFHIDGKPSFLFGTNQTGVLWFSPRENPATWEKDLSRMRHFGLRILRVLHFSPYAAKGYEGQGDHSALDLSNQPSDKLIRQTDELVAMCARHGIILMITLHDWLGIQLTDEELEAEKKWNRFWAGRYKDQNHVVYDIENEPSISLSTQNHLGRMWNSFLQNKYITIENLRGAWGCFTDVKSLNDIPLKPGPDLWGNRRFVDFNEFRTWLTSRWIHANVQGVHKGAPKALVTVGFHQNELFAEKFLSTGILDFSNTHYHGPVERFSSIFKLTDHRFRGQGLSVGEFGAWVAHEARVQGRFEDTTEPSVRHFLAVGHQVFGMGGTLALNWNLKDLDDCVFPWGLTYAQDGVPKDWYFAYRNMSYLFSRFQPKYELPEIFFVIPDNHRLGAQTRKIQEALHRGLLLLFACHVNFGVINERAIKELPTGVRSLIWPIPYCPDDEVFELIRRFVEQGGNLYFSGDIGFDPQRKATRAMRFIQLGLPPKPSKVPDLDKDSPDAKMTWITSGLGRGKVFYLNEPIELRPVNPALWNPYSEFLEQVNEQRLTVMPNDPSLHLFSVPETTGGRIFTLFRCESGIDAKVYRIDTGHGIFTVALRGWETGLIQLSQDGKPLAIEGSGDIRWNASTIIQTDSHVMVLDLNQNDILKSRRILILPTRPGQIDIAWAGIHKPLLDVGVMDNESKWNSFGNEPLAWEENRLRFKIDADMAMSMLLLREK